MVENSNRARDHLANERTFLAWVRTSVAIVVFGFAIGRFAIALRQLAKFQGQVSRTTGLSVWMGMIAILSGVAMVMAGLVRYRKTRSQLDEGKFEPAGFALRLGLKDVRLTLATAEECSSPMPLASLVHDHLLSALAQGQGELDWSSVSRVSARNAGL